MKYDLGIVGGLGPLASCYFYELITKKTKVNKDQDHLNIIILSDAKTPDRTSYILDNKKENPYPYLLNDCKTLQKLGCKLICIPCNTSVYFHDKLQKNLNIKLNNIIENTIEFIKNNNYKKVAIMATTGTINSNLYQTYLQKNNIQFILPNQENVMKIIYNYVKQGKKVPKDLWDKTVETLNVDAIILGCTELSILKKDFKLNDKYIDPLEIEADNVLKFFNKERL